MDISDMGESSWRGFIGSTASTFVVKGGGWGMGVGVGAWSCRWMAHWTGTDCFRAFLSASFQTDDD